MIPRKDWIRALSAFPEEEISKLVSEHFCDCSIKHLKIPQSGLALLKMKDAARKDHYYMGELPMSTAVIELSTSEGDTYQGAANVMHTSAQFAINLAVCDAVLAGQASNWGIVAEKVTEGMNLIAQKESVRNEILTRSKVDFSLLSEVGDTQK